MAGQIALDFTHRFADDVEIRASLHRSLAPGAIVVLFGPSGSGKTTILRAIAGLLRPDSGRIQVDDAVWFDSASAHWTPPQERRVGYVAQHVALFPHLTVRANIEYGIRRAGSVARRQQVDALIGLVGAGGLETRFPGHLSGGQAQRVALARALAPSPALLLLDEAFGALDGATRRTLRADLRTVLRATGTTAVLVTHDRLEAMAVGDDLAVVVGGQLRQAGSVADVFRHPADPDVARALGVETVVPAIVLERAQGLVTVVAGGAPITAVGGPECRAGAEVFACMRAEDVLVSSGDARPHDHGSARNQLAGIIVDIEPEGATDRLTIDCGFRLVAAITHQSRHELRLLPGSHVTAAIKATAVHLVPKI